MSTDLYTSLESSYGLMSILLKGPPGSGKTYKAAQFPKPVIFNFDNNLVGLQRLPASVKSDIKVINPHKKKGTQLAGHFVWDNFIGQLGQVLKLKDSHTVIFDSLTTLANCLMDKIMKTDSPDKAVEIQHYGHFARYMKWLGDDVLCAGDRDKVFLFLAHEQREDSGELTLNLPTKSVRDSFDLYFSDCWRCYTKVPTAGPVEYRVRCLPGTNFQAKCSLEIPTDFLWDKEQVSILRQVNEGIKRNSPAVSQL